jgi:hypothetical protein
LPRRKIQISRQTRAIQIQLSGDFSHVGAEIAEQAKTQQLIIICHVLNAEDSFWNHCGAFAISRGWKWLEVSTPPQTHFGKRLAFDEGGSIG